MTKIIFLVMIIPIYLVSLLPLKVHYFFAGIISFILEKVLRYRKSVVYVNISRSFPEFKYDRIEETVKKFYRNLSDIIVENIWLMSASKKSLAKIGTIENPKLVKDLYDRGKSVMFVAAHQGNWEFLTTIMFFSPVHSLGFSENQFIFVYKKQHTGFFDEIMKWLRSKHAALELVESGSAARYILKNKDRQVCYFLVADQAPLPGSKFVVDLLNQRSFIMNGPEVLSKKADIPTVFVNMNQEKRGRYRIRFSLIAENPALMADGEITKKYASLLEESICMSPENWLWSHKRWKRGEEENNR